MKKIRIRILEGGCNPCAAAAPFPEEPRGHMHTSDCEKPVSYKNAQNGEESRMHRTTLAQLMADVKVLLDLIQDSDDLPEWLETKITKAGDYMSSAARYIAGNIARDQGQLEEAKNCGCGQDPCVTYGKIQEAIEGNAQVVKTLISGLDVDELDQEQLESLYNFLKSLPVK